MPILLWTPQGEDSEPPTPPAPSGTTPQVLGDFAGGAMSSSAMRHQGFYQMLASAAARKAGSERYRKQDSSASRQMIKTPGRARVQVPTVRRPR